MLNRVVLFVVAAGALMAPVGEASAQDQPPPPARPAPDTELVFEREIFQYPSFTRRNPFRPLLGADGGGPRYEQLTVIGIIYSSDAGFSIATLTTGGVTVAEDGTLSAVEGDAFHLRTGESIGNTTIVEIRRDAVIVDVEVFDAVERETMTFVSRRQGGTR
jgi:hypothetical protein